MKMPINTILLAHLLMLSYSIAEYVSDIKNSSRLTHGQDWLGISFIYPQQISTEKLSILKKIEDDYNHSKKTGKKISQSTPTYLEGCKTPFTIDPSSIKIHIEISEEQSPQISRCAIGHNNELLYAELHLNTHFSQEQLDQLLQKQFQPVPRHLQTDPYITKECSYLVNTITTQNQRFPKIALLDDGNYAIIWENEENSNILGQLYGPSGVAVGEEFVVSMAGALLGDEPSSHVAAVSGSFIVVWKRTATQVFFRIFSNDISTSTDELRFEYDSTDLTSLNDPFVMGDRDLGFVIVVAESAQTHNIIARRYAINGVPADDPITVSNTPSRIGRRPSGTFITGYEVFFAWSSIANDAIGQERIYGRNMDLLSPGTASSDFLVSFDDGTQDYPHVAIGNDQDVITVWYGFSSTTVGYSIHGVYNGVYEFSIPTTLDSFQNSVNALDDMTFLIMYNIGDALYASVFFDEAILSTNQLESNAQYPSISRMNDKSVKAVWHSNQLAIDELEVFIQDIAIGDIVTAEYEVNCTCPDSTYQTSESFCIDCADECATCDDDGCITCEGSNTDCCPDSRLFNSTTNECEDCDTECATCDNDGCLTCPTSVTNCCPHGRFYNTVDENCSDCNDTCLTCDSEGCFTCASGDDCCPTNRYYDTTLAFCLNCPDNCATCDAIGCVTCNGSDVSCCPDGRYYSFGLGSCDDCPSECATCDSEGCFTCASGDDCCPTNRYYDTTLAFCLNCADNCASCDSSGCLTCNGSDVSCCPDGKYFNSQSSSCESCDLTCATCDSEGCLTCASGTGCCPTSRYFDTTLSFCLNCSDSCASCDSSGCLTCNGSDTSCCPNGKYFNSQSSSCEACDSACATCDTQGCLTCASGTDCCPTNRYFDTALSFCLNCSDSCASCDSSGCLTCNGSDTSCCPDGKYFNSQSSSCESCDSGCATCDSEGCLTCASGTDCCPTSRYFDTTLSFCLNCSDSCASCDSSGCLTCNGSDTSCCPEGKYFNSQNSSCEACDSACATCDSEGCLTCASGTDCCPASRYFDTTLSFCLNCSDSCASCDSSGCLTCNGSDTSCCPEGKYFNSQSSSCESCDLTCATCDNEGCLTCASGDDCCPTNRYFDTTLSFCLNCSDSCASCDSSGCLTCNGSDISCCPDGKYFNSQSSSCESCDSGCATCDSEGCLTCASGTDCCPASRYFDTTVLSCLNCANYCATCDSNGCLTCRDGNSSCCPSNRYYSGGNCEDCSTNCQTCDSIGCLSCIATVTDCCPSVRYYQSLSGACISCAVNCGTCDSMGCLACLAGDMTCCPSTRYFNTSTQSCESCSSECENCDSTGCLTCPGDSRDCCPPTRYFASVSCVNCPVNCGSCDSEGCLTCLGDDRTCCPSSKFFNSSTQLCEDCALNCFTCDEEGCLSCLGDDTDCCPSNKYYDEGCKACAIECSTCDELGCLSCSVENCCPILRYEENSICVDCVTFDASGCLECPTAGTNCCPSNRYFNGTTSCVDCPLNCASCDENGCLTCLGTDTSCCRDGQFFDGNLCVNCSGECLTCSTLDSCLECTNPSLEPPECCPSNQNDDDQDGTCQCNNNNTTFSDCNCEQDYVFLTIDGVLQCYGPISTDPVQIEGPTVIEDRCSTQDLVLRVLSYQDIDQSGITYAWSMDPPDIDLSDQVSSTLEVPVINLPLGVVVFTVSMNVYGAQLTGSQTITVNGSTVIDECLLAVIDPIESRVDPFADLSLNGSNSVDTADQEGSISYRWTCTGNCPIISPDDRSSLIIPSSSLLNFVTLEIVLTVSKDTRSASASVTIVLDACVSAETIGVNPDADFNVRLSDLRKFTTLELIWTNSIRRRLQDESSSCDPIWLSTEEVIILSENIDSGACYAYRGEYIDYYGNTGVSDVLIYGNLGPTCNVFEGVSPISIQASTISIEGCTDQDSFGSPLTYNLIVTDPSNTSTIELFMSETNTVSYSFETTGIYTLNAAICDSIGNCIGYDRDYNLPGTLLANTNSIGFP